MIAASDQRSFLRLRPGAARLSRPDGRRPLYAAAGRLERRHRRRGGLDQGDRRKALQGGQHGRRGGDRGADQCARRPRISLRVRRRRRGLRGVAGRRRHGARGVGGDRGLGRRRARAHFAGRLGPGRPYPPPGTRRARGALRPVGEPVLCDVRRRRPRLGRCRGQARRIRRDRRRRRAPGPISPACRAGSRNSARRAGLSWRCW